MKDLETALAETSFASYPEAFQTAMRFILPHETEFEKNHYGDYDHVRTENVDGDSGGATRYGVDKQAHPHLDVDNLDLAGALEVYHDEWLSHKLDQLPPKLAVAAFDVWVNGGHANEWLQQAYNATNPENLLAEDGQLGPASIAALEDCDADAVLEWFLRLRQGRFDRLAQKAGLAKFLNGWTKRNNDLAALLA